MRFTIRIVWVLFTIVGLNLWIDTHEENGVLNFIGMAMVSFSLVMMIDHVIPLRPKKRYVAERVMSSSEGRYWREVDAGKNPIPPNPCRTCGGVWQHLDKCVGPVNFSDWCMDPKVHDAHTYWVTFQHHCSGVELRKRK